MLVLENLNVRLVSVHCGVLFVFYIFSRSSIWLCRKAAFSAYFFPDNLILNTFKYRVTVPVQITKLRLSLILNWVNIDYMFKYVCFQCVS